MDRSRRSIFISVFCLSFYGLSTPSSTEIRLAPGDSKQGYETTAYVTDSLSLDRRSGQTTDLVANVKADHLGLPSISAKIIKPDAGAVEIGRRLFFDRRLSRNKTMSCAMCHIPEQGFTSNELERPIGFEGRSLKRNAPTILNVIFYDRLFADSRETTLSQQVWSPLLAENEMNNPSVGSVLETINSDLWYAQQFQTVYERPADIQNVGDAIAQYEQALIAGNSRFDRWFYGQEDNALSVQEQSGFELFRGKAMCASCHLVGQDYALFTDQQLHNTGIGFSDSMLPEPTMIEVQLGPGLTGMMSQDTVASVGDKKPNDVGRYEVTLNPADRWNYRTSTLRNIELTAPYMHNGEFKSLRDVVDFYDQGGVKHAELSPLIRPLALNEAEKAALVAFLGSLNGANVATL
ncbi:MAG: cytochrome c peroxidase, partial [Pseudomonadota bacterium]